MATGAIIAAAGSGNWKHQPRITLHTATIIKKIIMTFLKSGVSHIVIVAGENFEYLQKQMRNMDVEIVYNKEYEKSEMIDSARLAWEKIKDKCDDVLFTRGDLPMITSLTITSLIKSGADVAIPVFHGLEGHPFYAQSSIFDNLVRWEGANGLREAISKMGIEAVHVPVEDRGIIYNVSSIQERDTLPVTEAKSPEINDWNYTLKLELHKEGISFGPTQAMFCRMIDQTGSTEKASNIAGLEHDIAKKDLLKLGKELNIEIFEITRNSSKVQLTDEFRDFLNKWESFEKNAEKMVNASFDKYFHQS